MGRRRSSQASGTNLDSLMDTLTNVVGVLIIILVLVQINVSQALKKIVSELPPVTVEEFEKIKEDAKKQTEEYEKEKQQIEELRKKAQRELAELKKLTPELAALEQTAQISAVPLLDVDDVTRRLEEQRKLFEKRKAEMSKLLAEQQRLKAVLDTTPVVALPADTIVRLPNSRPIPEKAKLERYLITGDQIFHFDMDAASKLVDTELKNARGKLQPTRAKAADGSTKLIYDQDKVVKFFEQRRLALRNLDITVPYSKTSTRLSMRLSPKPGQGDPITAAMQLTSRFRSDLRRHQGANSVIWFLVARDGFNTYLRAREICDQVGVPVGWEVVTTPAYSEAIPDLEVTRLEEPKPTPTPNPNAPTTITIAPPKKKID